MDRAPLIMLVEDDPDDEELARIALRRAGLPHQLVVLRDGAQAVAWLRALPRDAAGLQKALPRVVLLDIKLPKLTGHQVLRRLRVDKRTRLLPVVMFSSSSEERDRVESYRLGANAYVRKPVDFDHYKRTLADLGDFWTVHNQAPPPGVERDPPAR
jgi:two-component system response regulator